MHLALFLPAVVLLLALAPGCGAGSDRSDRETPELLVLAASDLQHAIPEAAAAWEKETGTPVRAVLGSTGQLTTQIAQGAPGDLFLAANERFVDLLDEGGRTRPETRRIYALGRLALTWSPSAARSTSPAPLGAIVDLVRADVGTVAIANPEHAPYGQAAREALMSSGIWSEVQSRLVFGENVSQAFQFVRSGNADVGIVALGVVLGVPGTDYSLVDAGLHEPLRQAGVVLHEAEHPDAAAAFLDFLISAPGQEILRRYGFEAPDR